jgi:transcriptional regulator with XRE-family HTH domain
MKTLDKPVNAVIVVRGRHYSHFGAYFREKRRSADLTQDKTADALGYSDRQFISRIETGRVSLPIEKIPEISQIFKVSIQEVAEAVIEEQLRIIQERVQRVVNGAR